MEVTEFILEFILKKTDFQIYFPFNKKNVVIRGHL